MTSKALRENRSKIANDIKGLAAKIETEQREFTSDEQAEWDRLNSEYDSLTSQIKQSEVKERAEACNQDQAAKVTPNLYISTKQETRDKEYADIALQGWMRYQSGLSLEARHTEACNKTGINPANRQIDIHLNSRAPKTIAECRALSSVTGSAGAYLIPQGFVSSLEQALLAHGGMREASTIMRTPSGNDLPWPVTNTTDQKGQLIGENTAVSEQDITFDQIVFRAYKFTSKLVKVPTELLEDSAFDLASEVGNMLGVRLARVLNDEWTTGSGAARPQGVVTASALGKTAASATAITADEVKDLLGSIDPAYLPNASFMMHWNIAQYLWKLKDSNGRYIFDDGPFGGGLVNGIPKSLLGFPLHINQSMQSSVATATKTILFGDFSKYKIREVNSVRLIHLQERYMDADQHGFVAFMRADGALLDAGVAPVKHLLQA